MECPNCQAGNRAESKFCQHCGCAMPAGCAKCGATLLPEARFCDQCGQPRDLPAPAVPAGPAAPAPAAPAAPVHSPEPAVPRSVSGPLADRILQSRSAVEGERKQVTVLFADVKGSMEMAEQMDPEQWSSIMQRFFEILSEGVERFEGFVDKFTGDGIMALFGAPIAHENHAQRACYAALHLREAVKRHADELRRTSGISPSLRIGLNSGEVVVGRIGRQGDDLRMDYTAQGHTVGLAQRMEQRAAADSVYLTEHTASLVRGYFDLRDLGSFEIKGASAPVGGYELIGVGAHRTRLDRSRERGFSRLIGRSGELDTLNAALSRAVEGQGGVIGVVGEAGVGKSRLCMEFLERCRSRDIAVYEAHCPSHGQAVPLLPIFDLFRGYFGVGARDSDQTVREKIAGRVVTVNASLQDFLPLVFDFLGVADPRNPAEPMAPAQRQRSLVTFTRLLIQARSAREPAVLFVDDCHWIDPASDDFLAAVAEIVPGTRTVLLLNFRPEYSAEWMGSPFYQQLPLRPLGTETLDEFLAELLGTDPSTEALRGLIRERGGGNPLFIEEIVQALVESGRLAGAPGARTLATPIERLDLPPTVHGILAARIDRLAERERTLLQTASVIGMRFSASLLLQVSGLSVEDFEAAAAALRSAGFLYEEALYPDVEYAFRHPLTHEVAQGSLLASRRRQVHLAVARTLEDLYADKSDEHAALLAHHWDEGGQAGPAAEWHRRAAEWIAGSNAREARRHWGRVRELAEQIDDPARTLALGQQSRIMMLEYGWRLGVPAEEADEMLREGESWAERNDRPQSLAAFYNAYSIPCAFGGDPVRAQELAAKGLRLAEQAGDRVLACALELRLFFIAQARGLVHEMSAAMDAVMTHEPEELQKASLLVGYDVPAAAVGFRAAIFLYRGQLEEGLEHGRRGLAMARDCKAPEVESWMLWQESDYWCLRGDARRAMEAARASLEIVERIDNPLARALALLPLGRALLLAGDGGSALQVLEEGVDLLDRVHRCFHTTALADLAVARNATGDTEGAWQAARQALDLARQRGICNAEAYACHVLAGLHADRGTGEALAEASRLLDEAEAQFQEIGYCFPLPHLDELRGRIARHRGDLAGAEEAVRRAWRQYREMGAVERAERLGGEFAEVQPVSTDPCA